MRIFLIIFLLPLLALARAKVIENCTGVGIHGINYEKEVLKSDIDSPYQLALDYDTNILFFSYSTPIDQEDPFKSAYLNLKTNEFGVIKGVSGGFSNAIDDKNHIVYLGGNNGIYTYDFERKNAAYHAGRGLSIWQMFYKDKLYFTNYPDEVAHYVDKNTVKEVPELRKTRALLIAVDKHDNIVLSNSSGLYCYKKGKGRIVSIGDYNPNGFTTDMKNNLFFSAPEGLYTIDEGMEVQKLANIENVYGMVIEADGNIIYSDNDSIVRLKPTKFTCISAGGTKRSRA